MGNKQQWNTIIDHFLKEVYMKKYSFEQIIDKVKEMDLLQNPIWVKESNTQRKLRSFIDIFYRDKNLFMLLQSKDQ